jgi:hypothetical protein
MPFVYYDKAKKRYFVERRVPEDVQPIIGKVKVKHLFPQSVDHATANDLSFDIIRRWEAAWDRVRPHPKRISWLDPAGILARHERLAAAAVKVQAMVEAGQVILPTREEYLAIRQEARGWPTVESPMKVADARRVYLWENIIPEWETKRRQHNKLTSEEDKKDVRRILGRLFKFLDHTDMNAVTAPCIDAYVKDDLFGPKSVLGPGGYREHAIMLKSLFRLAFEKGHIDQNPTAGRLSYAKDTGRRDPFSCYLCLMDGRAMHSAAVVRLDYIDELVGHLLAARAFLKDRRGETGSSGTDDLVFGDERWSVGKLDRSKLN